MRVVDANVLLYAVNEDAEHHQPSRSWLDGALSGADTVGFTWIALLAFARITTKVGLFPDPLTVAEALDQIDDWLAAPGAQLLHASNGHAGLLREALMEVGSGGNLVNDAHLAAIARAHRASVVSYDGDFDRFGDVRRHRPDELLA